MLGYIFEERVAMQSHRAMEKDRGVPRNAFTCLISSCYPEEYSSYLSGSSQFNRRLKLNSQSRVNATNQPDRKGGDEKQAPGNSIISSIALALGLCYLLTLELSVVSAYDFARKLFSDVLNGWLYRISDLWRFYYLDHPFRKLNNRRSRNPNVRFEDVEGVDAAKSELMQIVSCLRGAIDYRKLGAKLPRGVLLFGPPGTGKTLLARAVAGEAGVSFFAVSACEFVQTYVGVGAARVRNLFSTARKSAPSVIFIDELDAIGGMRGKFANPEGDQTLNQLLTEMDGFESDSKVVVIGATNIPEALDPALVRPGRFSRKVYVGEPDEDGRRKIMYVHLRGVSLEEDPQLTCNYVASLTQGFVGATLANIVNEAVCLLPAEGLKKLVERISWRQ